MENDTRERDRTLLDERTERLIAIGAAAACNCIPCFEHLYENAILAGLTGEQIRRASEIAGQVKTGAHTALSNSVDELIGDNATADLSCTQTANSSCRC